MFLWSGSCTNELTHIHILIKFHRFVARFFIHTCIFYDWEVICSITRITNSMKTCSFQRFKQPVWKGNLEFKSALLHLKMVVTERCSKLIHIFSLASFNNAYISLLWTRRYWNIFQAISPLSCSPVMVHELSRIGVIMLPLIEIKRSHYFRGVLPLYLIPFRVSCYSLIISKLTQGEQIWFQFTNLSVI